MDGTAGFSRSEMSKTLFERNSTCSWVKMNRASRLELKYIANSDRSVFSLSN
jgi:hypothetical protein